MLGVRLQTPELPLPRALLYNWQPRDLEEGQGGLSPGLGSRHSSSSGNVAFPAPFQVQILAHLQPLEEVPHSLGSP